MGITLLQGGESLLADRAISQIISKFKGATVLEQLFLELFCRQLVHCLRQESFYHFIDVVLGCFNAVSLVCPVENYVTSALMSQLEILFSLTLSSSTFQWLDTRSVGSLSAQH